MNAPDRNDLFQTLFETAPDAMIVIDRTGRIVLANDQAGRLFGYECADLRGLQVEMLLPGELRTAHRAHRERFMDNPRVRPMGAGFELVGLRRDGCEFPVEIGLSPIRSDGDPLYAASIRDISETQRTRLTIARARYDAFVGQLGRLALESPDYEALWAQLPDLVADALGVEASAIVLFGRQHVERRAHGSRGMPKDLLEQLSVSLQQVDWRATEGRRDVMMLRDLPELGQDGLRALLADARIRDAALLPLFDLKDTVGLLLALTTDARAFDRDMLHLLQSSAHLFTAAMQRNRSEERLAHAHRLEAIGQLTGGVAHDFNNLLTIISGNLQLLEDAVGNTPAHATLVHGALRAVRSGGALTRKLLAFARRQRLSPRPIAPAGWLEDAAALLRRTLGEAVLIRTLCEDQLPYVFVDPGELDAVLVNLALNSRDAMPRGGELGIAVRAHDVLARDVVLDLQPGRYLCISVADTGIGMAPEVLARSMEPFFTTKTAGQGSGLGLSMVYGFAKQSGGTMHIESQLGYGTRVMLYLPAAPRSVPEAVEPEHARPDGAGETVLVVEDEPAVREIAFAFLCSLGYRTCVAANAEEALEALGSRHVDLLFSDVVLGSGMTGLELANEAQRSYPNLQVLFASGYEHPLLDANGGAERIQLVRKPYSREELAAAIRAVLDRR